MSIKYRFCVFKTRTENIRSQCFYKVEGVSGSVWFQRQLFSSCEGRGEGEGGKYHGQRDAHVLEVSLDNTAGGQWEGNSHLPDRVQTQLSETVTVGPASWHWQTWALWAKLWRCTLYEVVGEGWKVLVSRWGRQTRTHAYTHVHTRIILFISSVCVCVSAL